ncbi:putative Alpha-L-rhamnosidase six-hairpin glycosidase domain-containing protein [Seiridium unicorne]|uniref:Alpha-L-rhamnosidase six-hairpin glycosidase domain-containing protein n=1 Tax=Seiridium unicorne TaxID=138068 RepID=A0ABR2V537_9PEZI
MYWLYPTEPLSGASSCPGHYVAGMGLAVDTGDVTTFTLDSDSPLVTLDYGTERAGYPFFSAGDVTHRVQIEVKYSESSVGLALPWADGPYSFATGLANSFRVERFNVTSPGRFATPLIQGQ